LRAHIPESVWKKNRFEYAGPRKMVGGTGIEPVAPAV
jgi:hypothetical protein